MRVRVRAAAGRAPERGRGVSRRWRAVAEPEAPQNGAFARNQVGDEVGDGVFSARVVPLSTAPKPLEINNLSKYRVVAMQPLQTKSLASRPSLRLSEPRPRRNCGATAVRALEVGPEPTSAPNHAQLQPTPCSTSFVPAWHHQVSKQGSLRQCSEERRGAPRKNLVW